MDITLNTLNPLAVLADIAHTQIGVHEVGGENCGPQVAIYQSATSEPGTSWPWCAAFVCWCVRELTRLRPGMLSCDVHHCRPADASVEGLIDWAGRTRQLVFTPGTLETHTAHPDQRAARPQAGDIVCMRFGTGRHVGIATGEMTEPTPDGGFVVPTIEGNTTGPYHNKQDQRNGGEVAAKTRSSGNITHFIRLTIQAEPATKPNA